MVSNALSPRRGPLPYPKVCLTPKNPGRCKPPPPPGIMVCSLFPSHQETQPDIICDFTLTACDPGSPTGSTLGVHLDGGGGTFVYLGDPKNCEDVFCEFSSPNLGFYYVSVTSISQGGVLCVSAATVEVVPM